MERDRLRRKKGFTLLEVMCSLFIAALVLVGVLEAFLYLTAISTANKNRTRVFQDVQMTMERISGIPFSSLTTQFPNGQALSSSFVTNVLGGYKLGSESITVSYPNGVGSNPREVLVLGQWTEKGRAANVSLRTFRRG